MIVRVRGVNKVRAKGRIYYYHRASGVRLRAEFGSAAFFLELDRLNATPPAATAQNKPGTWGALVTAYRGSPEFGRLAERTRADYQKVLDYLAPLDAMPLLQLNSPAVIEIRDRAFRQKKRRFANHVLQVLTTILNWGRPRGLTPATNPAAGIPKIPRPRDLARANRPWTPAECVAVLEAAVGGIKLAIALGMFAAMRIGDAARVTWSIYDGAALEWRQGKTGDEVWVPVHRDLRALLDGAARPATTIVTGSLGRPLTDAGLAKAFRTLILQLERTGKIGGALTFHGLRHTAGNTLADLGAEPRMIQALLGQRSMAAALHYSDRADRRRAATAAVHVLERGTRR
jgi:integrase